MYFNNYINASIQKVVKEDDELEVTNDELMEKMNFKQQKFLFMQQKLLKKNDELLKKISQRWDIWWWFIRWRMNKTEEILSM